MKLGEILCRIGLHKWYRIIGSYTGSSEGGRALTGEVLTCARCGVYSKWGTAYYPDYIKKQLKGLKNG